MKTRKLERKRKQARKKTCNLSKKARAKKKR